MSLRYGIIKTGISFGCGHVTSPDCIKQSQSVSMNSSIHEAIANLSSWNWLHCWAYRCDIAVAWQSYGLLLNPVPAVPNTYIAWIWLSDRERYNPYGTRTLFHVPSVISFLSFPVCPLLPTHCRCSVLLMHLITLTDTHTHTHTQLHSVEFR
jgi:hypothetical protein